MKTTEQYEEQFVKRQNSCECKKCHTHYIFKPDEAKWIEYGTYSVKVATCPDCGCVNVVKYQDGFNQNPNLDRRYFD